MMFFPFGFMSGESIDPDKIAKEYEEAARVASETGQYQWAANAFSNLDSFELGAGAKIFQKSVTADLQATRSQEPILDTSKYNGGITPAAGTTDAGVFQIPYARGFSEVTDTDYEWTSSYPELVWVIFSHQYIRNNTYDFDAYQQERVAERTPIALNVRAQVRVSVDGALMPGSGPFAAPLEGVWRGSGFSGRSYRSTCMTMTHVSSGTHRVVAMAGQAPHSTVGADLSEITQEVVKYMGYPPVEGVCIGNRRMIVVRFPKGGGLGG